MMKIITRILMATVLIMVTAGSSSAQAAAQQSRSAPPYSEAVPDENTLARLVWSTMVALDNANRTETYSVLYARRSLSAAIRLRSCHRTLPP